MAVKTITATASMTAGMTVEVQAGGHTIYMDQPKNAGGADKGPTPPDFLIGALAGCLGTIGRIVAHQQKIALRGMQFEIEADFDTDRLMGKATENRAGFSEVRLKVDIDADLSPEQKQTFLEEIERRCPIADNLINGTMIKAVVA
ncbi:OsmC family protein [Thiopseudomonas alkaliphila]|uniref:OsmC family protein n=1 Tax=Thiopseudomonas alkaliphila TaxID=1697053 RepID=UPI00069FD745|nr:OsmC family protein [Thiopseudomonas alkaliphila]AKX50433.1 osmotically inducible protein C [Thiopseudomonas alkaliphila]AKX54728.1 osmotically inducible protein C [Thiopseudomonas alkaliphila]AKX56769.1 osmotically inducible protein C [Thiopseudomonas alkaliphila]MDM1707973.1 OsmC family protein [Thiopseudomonas alkaliphila]